MPTAPTGDGGDVPAIPLSKLEVINDMIADGIDRAGGASEVFLAKALFHLAAHAAGPDALRAAIEASLRHLPSASMARP